jgi:hypothetical protein
MPFHECASIFDVLTNQNAVYLFQPIRHMYDEGDEEPIFVTQEDWKLINPNLPYPEDVMKYAIRLDDEKYKLFIQDLLNRIEEDRIEMDRIEQLPPELFRIETIESFKRIPDYKEKLKTGELNIWLRFFGLTAKDIEDQLGQPDQELPEKFADLAVEDKIYED